MYFKIYLLKKDYYAIQKRNVYFHIIPLMCAQPNLSFKKYSFFATNTCHKYFFCHKYQCDILTNLACQLTSNKINQIQDVKNREKLQCVGKKSQICLQTILVVTFRQSQHMVRGANSSKFLATVTNFSKQK